MSIQQIIKKLRQAEQLTQRQISLLLNCSVPAYSKMETGCTDLTHSRLTQLAKVYKLTISEIYAYGENGANKLQQEIYELKESLKVAGTNILQLQSKVIELYEECSNRKK